MNTPFFMTHHSPIGAYASFTFGAIGKGVSIDLESPRVKEERYDLYAGYSQDGVVMALPFRENISMAVSQLDSSDEGNKEIKREKKNGWTYFAKEEITRTLTPCIDRFEAGRMTLEVYTPHPALEDPEKETLSDYAVCPGMLMRLVIDNQDGDTSAVGNLGLGNKVLRYIHSVQTDGLKGLGCKNSWMLLTDADSDAYLLRSFQLDYLLQNDVDILHETGPGAICIKVQPGEKKELLAAFGFYTSDPATCGIETHYAYGQHFANVREVCRLVLDNAARIREESEALDAAIAAKAADPVKLQLLAQGVRGYEASTQLGVADGKYYYNVGEGAYCWRNTLDLAADHLPWELYRNPWVVRNIMDLYMERYSYHDKVTFDGEPGKLFEGGLSFTHDMGNFVTFSGEAHSDYETDRYVDAACYFYMTIEELLNGIYCICAYALYTGDMEWMKKRATVLRELLCSMENRDHHDPAKRDGILKATSSRCGQTGKESTTYDALDHSLMDAPGNLYVAVKTGCALIMLQKCFDELGDTESSARAAHMLKLNQASLKKFQTEDGILRANLYSDTDSRVLAAAESLAVPYMLGLTGKAIEPVKELLLTHIRGCMQEGHCIDETTGGVRLSSKSNNTWVSKVILCFAVMEKVFDINLEKEYPAAMRELAHWCQISAKDDTISDQVLTTERKVIGGCYYPRSASTAIWIY